MTLRQRLARLFVMVNLLPEPLAEAHAAEMTDDEVYRRLRLYAEFGAEFSSPEEVQK